MIKACHYGDDQVGTIYISKYSAECVSIFQWILKQANTPIMLHYLPFIIHSHSCFHIIFFLFAFYQFTYLGHTNLMNKTLKLGQLMQLFFGFIQSFINFPLFWFLEIDRLTGRPPPDWVLAKFYSPPFELINEKLVNFWFFKYNLMANGLHQLHHFALHIPDATMTFHFRIAADH